YFLMIPPTPPTIYPLSLHDALPICCSTGVQKTLSTASSAPACFATLESRWMSETSVSGLDGVSRKKSRVFFRTAFCHSSMRVGRSEEHTSELQSRGHLVCRLLLEKK